MPPVPTPRAATAADLPALERLLAAAGLPTAGVAAILAARPGDFRVADDPAAPGELAAAAGLEACGEDRGGGPSGGSALLRSVAVRPAWRASGLGAALVRALLAGAEARGLDALYLLTTTAEGYFPPFGFAPVARAAVPPAVAATVEFTSACPASATVMAKRLTGARLTGATTAASSGTPAARPSAAEA